MPLNKDALVRYRVINRYLIDHQFASLDKLIESCEEALGISPIGKRTIEKDIHDMKKDVGLKYNAPIRFSRDYNGYYYSKKGFSIDNIPVNKEEVKALAFAASLLNQYKSIDLLEDFSGAVQKIVQAINIRRDMDEISDYKFIEFEKMPLLKGTEYIKFLIEAIKTRQVVSLTYRKFNSTHDFVTNIHPYLIKEYHNRWYLVGLNDEYKEIRTYGLERVQKIEINESLFYLMDNFDSEKYFRNAVGIIAPQSEPVLVKLKFNKRQGQYAISLPIHESQELIEETNEHVIISINVTLTYELFQMVIGWGCDVEVLEPKELRKQMRDELKMMGRIYEKK